MGVGKHACPQVGVLRLGPIIIIEDKPQGALLGCSHQGATLPCVTDQEIELPLVYDQLLVNLFPSATLPWVNLPIKEQASSLSSGNQTSVCLPKETIASLTLRDFSKSDSTRNAKSGVGAQPASAKCLPNQAGMTGCQLASNSHSWTSANPVPMSLGRAPLIAPRVIWWLGCPNRSKFCFTNTLEGCRIAGLHIDAVDVPRIVVHRVPQPVVSVFHTSLLNVREEADWG